MSAHIVDVRGALSLPDLVRFQYYSYYHRAGTLITVVAVGLALATIALLPAIAKSVDWESIGKNAIPVLLLLLFWVCSMLFQPYRQAKKQYESRKYLQETVGFTFRPDGIWTISDSDSSQMTWNVIHEIRETKDLFLMYYGSDIALIVPKRFFVNESHIRAWRDLVTTCFSRGIVPPRFVGRWC